MIKGSSKDIINKGKNSYIKSAVSEESSIQSTATLHDSFVVSIAFLADDVTVYFKLSASFSSITPLSFSLSISANKSSFSFCIVSICSSPFFLIVAGSSLPFFRKSSWLGVKSVSDLK